LKGKNIWKIWKKGKFDSVMIWKIWNISVFVKITPKKISSSSSSSSLPQFSSSLYTLFFRIEKNHPGTVFC
jgi:hypothetical protein